MSVLTRAFTMRSSKRNHFESVDHPDFPIMAGGKLQRNQSARVFDRSMISSPVLLSTTNVQTLNTMSIASAQKQQSLRKVSSISSASSRASEKDADGSSTGTRSRGTSVTDHSSVGGGSNPSSPKPNDSPNNTYFSHSQTSSIRKSQLIDDDALDLSRNRSDSGASKMSVEMSTPNGPKKAKSSVDLKAMASTPSFDPTVPLPAIPAIPARNPSHSKFAHEQLAKKKSMRTMSGTAPPSASQNKWASPPRSVPDDTLLNRASRSSSNSSAMSKPLSFISTNSSSSSTYGPPKRALSSQSSSARDSQSTFREQRARPDPFSANFDAEMHPFATEIQQLDRITEEIVSTVRDAAYEDDMKVMRSRKLHKFCASDYAMDLNPMWDNWFVPGHDGGKHMEVAAANRLVGWI